MGIKSFMGKRIKPSKGTFEKVKVSDYMTRNLVTFTPEQSVMEVIDILLRRNISGGPVVNEKNELIGIISEGDCLKEISDCRYHNHPIENIKVKEHMIKNVETIDGDMNVLDAANKFLESKHRRFPISAAPGQVKASRSSAMARTRIMARLRAANRGSAASRSR